MQAVLSPDACVGHRLDRHARLLAPPRHHPGVPQLPPYGKHFHIITGLPNVFFKRLPPAGQLAKLDLEAEEQFGVDTVKDLSWKEGLDIYSCTECGRCQTHCPTYVTGKPLTHKEVNRALRHHLSSSAPTLVAL